MGELIKYVVKSNANKVKNLFRLVIFVFVWFNLVPRLNYELALVSWLSLCWRLFCEHACGHRYLSHRSYHCKPWLLQLMVVTILTRDMGPFFYWCFLHNIHHMHCDTKKDFHSPKNSNFWSVQFNFVTTDEDIENFKMFENLPEQSPRNFNRLRNCYDADLSWVTTKRSLLLYIGESLFWILLGFYLSYAGYDWKPFELFIWVNFVPRVLTAQAANLTNSAGHTFGSSPYTNRPDSPHPQCQATNCWWAALLNMGEGWHSNHHGFALSARHGLLWWEIDVTYYGLCLLGHLGLVWNMRTVDDSIRLAPRDQPMDKYPDKKYTLLFVK